MSECAQFGIIRTMAMGGAALCRNFGIIAVLAALYFALPVLVWVACYAAGTWLIPETVFFGLWLVADVLLWLGVMACVVDRLDGRQTDLRTLLKTASAGLIGSAVVLALLAGLILIVLAFVGGIVALIARVTPIDLEEAVDWVVVLAMLAPMPFFLLSIPAIVSEGIGPIVSLRRSFELTEGCRWRVLCVLVLRGLVYGTIAGFVDFMAKDEVIALVVDALLSAWGASILAFAYHELARIHDGPPAAAFD